MTEYERFGLVFTKTWVYKFGHCTVYWNEVGAAGIYRTDPVIWEFPS